MHMHLLLDGNARQYNIPVFTLTAQILMINLAVKNNTVFMDYQKTYLHHSCVILYIISCKSVVISLAGMARNSALYVRV